MSQFVFHPEAFKDLEEIWEYIAENNREAADRVVDEMQQAIRTLVSFPHQGHHRPDLTSKPVRFHSVRDFLIAHIPDTKPLAVLAILHGRRHPRVIAALLRSRQP